MGLGIEADLHLGIKVKRETVITVENKEILYGSVRKRKEIKINKGTKVQMQQIVEVAEGSWFNLWPGAM